MKFGTDTVMLALRVGTKFYDHDSGKDGEIIDVDGVKHIKFFNSETFPVEEGYTLTIDVLSCSCGCE